MNQSLSLSSLTAPISKLFARHHATLFFAFIVLLLAAAILSLYLTTQSTTKVTTETEVISSTFDQQTVNQIQDLKESNETSDTLVFPSPRSNPFVE